MPWQGKTNRPRIKCMNSSDLNFRFRIRSFPFRFFAGSLSVPLLCLTLRGRKADSAFPLHVSRSKQAKKIFGRGGSDFRSLRKTRNRFTPDPCGLYISLQILFPDSHSEKSGERKSVQLAKCVRKIPPQMDFGQFSLISPLPAFFVVQMREKPT